MMGLKFDKTISIPDILTILGAALAMTLAYAELNERINVTRVDLGYTSQAVREVGTELRLHKTESLAADMQIKQEVRDNLRDINAKLDRLVERELERNGSGK